MADAVVIGAGPNGLVAAALLADRGWSVEVVEAADEPGGACRSAEGPAPGFITDRFSSFYPLAACSPVLRSLQLAQHGLRWAHAPKVLAHPLPDAAAAIVHRDLARTSENLERDASGDGQAWSTLVADWRRVRSPLLDTLFTPFPPLRPGVGLVRALGVSDALHFARFATLPARRFAEEQFSGAAAGLLIAGNALHTDLAPDSAGSAIFGWLLAMCGQEGGFPVPEGGSSTLSTALARRAVAAGARIRTGVPVAKIVIRAGRAVAVRLADGTEIDAGKAVVADVDAPQLYLELVGAEHLPPRLRVDVARFQWDNATVKVNWALRGPIPWRDEGCHGAGTVHLGGTIDDLSVMAGQLFRRVVPASPFLILGQLTTADPHRSPAGTESVSAYSHVPQHPVGDAGDEGIRGAWTEGNVAKVVARMETVIERYAPGFSELVIAREVQSPTALHAADRNLHRGALNGGSAAVHQELVFRPVPGLGRAETVIGGLYLASMSAHPGGGVHGGPGANAARAALAANGTWGPIRRKAFASVHRALYRSGSAF